MIESTTEHSGDVHGDVNTGGNLASSGEKDCLGKILLDAEFNDAKKSK